LINGKTEQAISFANWLAFSIAITHSFCFDFLLSFHFAIAIAYDVLG
jgi:hypothetical protein